MNRPIELCPNCNGRRELDLSLGLITHENIEGVEDILVYHYHCASCNSYVRSTTMDHEGYTSPDESMVFSIPEYVQLPP